MNQPSSAFVTRPARLPRRAVPVVAPTTDSAQAAPTTEAAALPTFGIAVGEYVNEARANSERAKIGDVTKLASRVVTVAEDTVSIYRVVIGSYSDRAEAERAASDLVQRGLVNEARVVSVAQRAGDRP